MLGVLNRLYLFAALLGAIAATPAAAQTKWELATNYAESAFHTKNIAQFARDVEKAVPRHRL